ncbi:hypothetical protein KQ311_01210 [Synechocystis sp. CS-94]|nr:hypothetical protein [Synechocystis sp. CS-94]
MMKSLLRGVALSGSILLATGGYGLTASAQVAPGDNIPTVEEALDNPDVDDITDQPDQLITWVCKSGDKTVAVEVKELQNWQETVDPDQTWQCEQNIPVVDPGDSTFSCETNATMGLITVFWLEGEGGKAEMTSWMNNLANNQNMVCTHGQTNPFWE